MQEKVEKRFTKWGNNPEHSKKMAYSKTSEWAYEVYSTPSKIAEAILNTFCVSGVER